MGRGGAPEILSWGERESGQGKVRKASTLMREDSHAAVDLEVQELRRRAGGQSGCGR